MSDELKNTEWNMTSTLTEAGLVVPPLGSTDPRRVRRFGEAQWGNRSISRFGHLYLFNVAGVARNIVQHGPLFTVADDAEHTHDYVLTVITTAPCGDVAYFTQYGLDDHVDGDDERAFINASQHELAKAWAVLQSEPRSDRVRWLMYRSHLRFDYSGIVDLDALRNGADFDSADQRVGPGVRFEDLFAEIRSRRAARIDEPQTTTPIAALTPHLAEALRRLEDDSHLVIGVHGSTRYVQFATFRPNLRLETIGIRYLDDAGEAWSADEPVWLADHGWRDADGAGNFWREWTPADEDGAATAAVGALVHVHGVSSLEQVWFQSGDDRALDALEAATLDSSTADPGQMVRTLPPGTTYVSIADYVAGRGVLELLAITDSRVFRRHDTRWYRDKDWDVALRKAPARSVVPLTKEVLDDVMPKVDAFTAGQRWKPFRLRDLEMYWPSYRPNDPHVFDWSQVGVFDEDHEAG